MRRRWLYVALGSLFAVAACSDQGQNPPTAPQLKVTPDPLACDFGQVKNLINSYFMPPNQSAQSIAQGYESNMETAGKWTATAIFNGYRIMDLIGQVSRSTSPSSATVGSDLTKALAKCMFDASQSAFTSLHNGGGINAVRFDSALVPLAGGVYYVVGADFDISSTPSSFTDPSVPNVLNGKVGTTKLSAVAPGPEIFDPPPATTFTLGNWTDLLAGDASGGGGRALIYGYPVTQNPIVYEWAAIHPWTTFSPYALVSICDNSTDPTQMVTQTSVGALAFSQANLCGLPDATGGAKDFRSHFNDNSVTDIHLDWITTFPARMKVGQTYTAVARATFSLNGVQTGVNGACLIVSGANMNGTPFELVGTKECDNPSSVQLAALTKSDPTSRLAGYATFSLTSSKSGGATLTLSGFEVVGRASTFANTVQTKANFVP